MDSHNDFEADADAFLSNVLMESGHDYGGVSNPKTKSSAAIRYENSHPDSQEEEEEGEEEESGQWYPSHTTTTQRDQERDLDHHHRERGPTRILAQTDPGPPNRSILLHGLNYSTTQESLSKALQATGANLESLHLVLDKATGKSRGFAFCKFKSVEEAVEWMQFHLKDPFIIHDFIPKLEYVRDKPKKEDFSSGSGSNGGGGLQSDWHCFSCATKNFTKRDSCFRCGMLRVDSDRQIHDLEQQDKVNKGLRDIGSVPFHILLFRNVDSLTTENSIWQQTVLECSPSSIWLVRDRKTRTSLGHCFVQFESVELANKLLNKIFKSGKEVKPFYIETRMIEVSYAHMGSFIPSNKVSPFACLVNQGMFLSYWDASAYCRPYPEDQVDPAIPPLPSIEEYMALQDLQIAKRQQEERDAAAAKELKRRQKNVVPTKMSIQLQRWNAKQKEIGDLDELMEVSFSCVKSSSQLCN